VRPFADGIRACLRRAPCLAVLASACLVPSGAVRAAFELDSMSPAARGCSNVDAMGLADGSVSTVFHGGADAPAVVARAFAYRPFALAGVDVVAARVRLVSRSMRTGLCLRYDRLGAPGYAEHSLSVSVGIRRKGVWIQPGLRLGRVAAKDAYGGGCLMLDFSTYAYVTGRLRISFAAANALGSRLDVPGGGVPRRVAAGLGYAACRTVACGLRIEKENGRPTALGTGIEWRPARGLSIRLGSRTYPREFSLGLGVSLKGLCVDFSSTANFDLGLTHAAGVTWARR